MNEQIQESAKPMATPYIIQNGNVYQLTTTSNTHINLSNSFFTTANQQQNNNNNNNNNKIKLTTTTATTTAPKKIIYKTTQVQLTNDKTNAQQTKQPIIVTTVKQQPQQQQQQQQPSIIVLQQQPHAIPTNKPQKVCYIPISTSQSLNNKTQLKQATTQPVLTSITTNASGLVQQVKTTNTQTTPSATVSTASVLNIKNLPKANMHQTADIKQEPKQQTDPNNRSNILNEYVTPDSRIFKSFLKNNDLQQQQQSNGQLQYLNDVLTYKIVKLGVNEHILLDNDENLLNFCNDIEKLQAFAYILATKLNKPVTIPAYLSVNLNNLDNIQNLLKQRNVKPLFEQNKDLMKKQQKIIESAVLANSTMTTNTQNNGSNQAKPLLEPFSHLANQILNRKPVSNEIKEDFCDLVNYGLNTDFTQNTNNQ